MHQSLYSTFLLATAIFLMAFSIFTAMVIAAVVSLMREHNAKLKPAAKANHRFSSVVARVQSFVRKEGRNVKRSPDIP